jgi:hypothetical protein
MADERLGTHWADCWRVHHPCAVAKIARLARAVRIQRQELLTIAAAGAGRVSELAARALREGHGEL